MDDKKNAKDLDPLKPRVGIAVSLAGIVAFVMSMDQGNVLSALFSVISIALGIEMTKLCEQLNAANAKLADLQTDDARSSDAGYHGDATDRASPDR